MKEKKHILLCEDNELVLQITGFAIEAEGFNVDTAMSTDEIFQKLENKTKPSLILLDLNIPEAGGESVINHLKNLDAVKNIPIILFSGKENLEEIAASLKADGFLRKPFDNADLKKILQKFIHNDT